MTLNVPWRLYSVTVYSRMMYVKCGTMYKGKEVGREVAEGRFSANSAVSVRWLRHLYVRVRLVGVVHAMCIV